MIKKQDLCIDWEMLEIDIKRRLGWKQEFRIVWWGLFKTRKMYRFLLYIQQGKNVEYAYRETRKR